MKKLIIAIVMLSAINADAQTITVTKQMKQCKGQTKKNVQCKRLLSAKNVNNYCYQHLAQKK